MDDELDLFGWVGATVDGKYRVDAVVGRGGFGVVYRAHHLGFDQTVALKCLRLPKTLAGPERERFQQTFLAEGRLLHQLSRATAGIVQALDMGAAVSPSKHWTPYLVLEWLQGRPLDRDLLERRNAGFSGRTVPEALRMLSTAARALAVAHEQGVAHRDIKPANLFLSNIGGQTVLKVLDFGIAKVMAESESVTRAFEETGATLQAFTARYGAPEQFSRRYGATGPWTDVFALALVFVEAVLGRPVLDGTDAAQLFVASSDPERRPTLRNAGYAVPDAIENVLTRALAVDPRERYTDAGQFWQALEAGALEAGLGSTAPPSPRVSLTDSAERAMPLGADAETAPEASASAATELSSSRHVPSSVRAASKSKPRRRTASWIALTVLALGLALAALVVSQRGTLGSSVALSRAWANLRKQFVAPAPAAPAPTPVTSVSPVPAPAPDADAVSPPGDKQAVLELPPPPSSRPAPFGGLPQRDVPAGVAGDAYMGPFRVLARSAAFGLDFAGASQLCADVGSALCTEQQWERSCDSFPELRSVASWTQSVRDDAVVVRGGESCQTTHTADESERAPERYALCCDRAIAMNTNNLQKQYLMATAARVLVIEKALNQRNIPALLEACEPSVLVDGESKTQAQLGRLIEKDFSSAPDLLVTNGSCDVSVQSKKVTKRVGRQKRKVVTYETQGWTARCEQTATLAGSATARTVTYHFSAASKLREIVTRAE